MLKIFNVVTALLIGIFLWSLVGAVDKGGYMWSPANTTTRLYFWIPILFIFLPLFLLLMWEEKTASAIWSIALAPLASFANLTLFSLLSSILGEYTLFAMISFWLLLAVVFGYRIFPSKDEVAGKS